MESSTRLQASLILLVSVTCSFGQQIRNGPALKMDQALLTFHNQLNEQLHVFYTTDFCYKCVQQHLVSVQTDNSNSSATISTKFTLTLQVEGQNRSEPLCRWSQTYEEGGRYSVWIQAPVAFTHPVCSFSVDKSPNNAHLPLLVVAFLLAITALLFVVVPYVYRRRCTKCRKTLCCQDPQYSVDNDDGETAESPGKAKPSRLLSLDTFRGFALTVMVFVNYGGGGYWFLQHAPWNGLTVADLVMPWFVFIMGTSVVLAFSSMQRRGVSRLQLLRKVTWRTAVLMLLGFCFLNYSPRDGPLSWSWLRIPGVLQRLGFTYFVLSLLQTFWGQTEIPEREGTSAAALCKCTRDGGFIPVNKNLWSLSYVMCMGCFSFLLLGGMYLIIDVKGWWSGQPFINPGTNSILVYVGHSLLGFYFPFSWEIRFQESHWELLLQNLWGTALWVLVSYLLYRKKFFLKI
ncbi:heparan-alpha-glucosaminide N-acetyltransferase [Nematolebias whitei]|uniref:heparan-alpha-glucosaminide N-acetyltransferase n=1 Tax=Nematolebias whitei TaxID=451745 RepID=UPI00189A7739|nr:heparan-alpha-glucosaminide N-acetyltransferase [Nematolebias whitei]